MIEAFEIKPAFTIKLFTYMKGDGPMGNVLSDVAI